MSRASNRVKFLVAAFSFTAAIEGTAASLSYRDLILASAPPSLSANVQIQNTTSGSVTINGVDTRRPSTPFRFDWGDGQTSQGFFPASHTYADRTRNYVATITATYGDATTASTPVSVRFVPVVLRNFDVPADIAVTMPRTMPSITSTQPGYSVPAVQLVPDSVLTAYGQAVFERVMGAFAVIQQDLVNDDWLGRNGTFRQIAMAPPQPTQTSAYSVWFTDPVMFVAPASVFGANPNWSTMAHEMGHNATLNSPAAFRMGGRIDGNANAIVSESLAQIFEHVTCHLLVNNAAYYGIPDDLATEIARSARASFASLRAASGSAAFSSWNNPATPADETFATFMSVAYQFFAAGDFDGVRYRGATKRLMRFLQRFNPQWQTRFSATANTPAAESFRATMMVAAVSYGVDRDLRETFRGLGFPIDDGVFNELTATVGPYPEDAARIVNLSVRSTAGSGDRSLLVGFAVGGSGTKQLLVRGIGPALTEFGVDNVLPDPQLRLANSQAQPILDNNDWPGGGFATSTFEAVGAFPLAPNSRDAAVVPTLRPGTYSAQISATTGAGVALVEVYDLDGLGGLARLANLSARTEVGAGDNILVAGFVVQGSTAKRLLVRAIGPTLAQFGVGGVLGDPQLRLFRGSEEVAANNDWGGGAVLADSFAQVGAFALEANSRDAALVVTLPPGAYSAQVSGSGAATGIALVEMYVLP